MAVGMRHPRAASTGGMEGRAMGGNNSSSAGVDRHLSLDLFDSPPVVRMGVAEQVKKGEDCYRTENDGHVADVSYKSASVFDGHNGSAAAQFAKETLLKALLQLMPADAGPCQWLEALPLAMAGAFLLCHAKFAERGQQSGTTATLAVLLGWTVTVAWVGDSRAILDTLAGGVTDLTMDHRFESSAEEQARVMKEGARLGRLQTKDGTEVGPLRSWPGGLCVSRSIGDMDCGNAITPLPHVKQVEVPRTGGRIILASDGLWDAVDSQTAAKRVRGMNCSAAALLLVKESIKAKGLRDDITVLVIDMLPADTAPSDVDACPVPKAPTPRMKMWPKFKPKSSSSKGSSKKEAIIPPKSHSVGSTGPNLTESEDVPLVMSDHDSVKGGNLYERVMANQNASVHAGGNFCAICGQEISGVMTQDGLETSIRAGNFFCNRHNSLLD